MGFLTNIARNRTQRVEARQTARTERQTARQAARTERQTARQAQRQASTEAKAAGGKWDPASVAARQAGFAQLGAAGAQLAGSAFMASAGVPPQVGQVLGALDVGQVGQVLGDLGLSTGASSSGGGYGAAPMDDYSLSTPPTESGGIGAWVQENPLLAAGLALGVGFLVFRKRGA